ncbi:MAG: hypothetical protein IPP49_09500 [Saprospiraceae bacterium]|nr:hypothetical protein [Saprospiraceae bacterium]
MMGIDKLDVKLGYSPGCSLKHRGTLSGSRQAGRDGKESLRCYRGCSRFEGSAPGLNDQFFT